MRIYLAFPFSFVFFFWRGVGIDLWRLTLLDFGDDQDVGFSFNDKDIAKQPKKPYEVEFKVLDPSDIEREQSLQIDEVSAILGLPPESAAILLRHSRWNREKLIESYMDRPEQTLEEGGLGPDTLGTPKTEIVPGFMCEICCEDSPGLETYKMRCGHRFCVDCYRHYLFQKIKEEGESSKIECPQDNCHLIVDSKSLTFLVSHEVKDRYVLLLIQFEISVTLDLA